MSLKIMIILLLIVAMITLTKFVIDRINEGLITKVSGSIKFVVFYNCVLSIAIYLVWTK